MVVWQDGKWAKRSDFEALQATLARVTAERDAAVAGRVKPLVWGVSSGLMRADDYEIHLEGTFGTGGYADPRYKVMRLGRVIVGIFPTLEAAKAAAQADYNARILAALEPRPPTGDMVSREACIAAIEAEIDDYIGSGGLKGGDVPAFVDRIRALPAAPAQEDRE